MTLPKTWPPQSAHGRRLRDNLWEFLPREDAGMAEEGNAVEGVVYMLLIYGLIFAAGWMAFEVWRAVTL